MVKGVEVGNIFPLGTKFSDAFELNYTDETGELRPVVMGSYGIGPGRTMGVIVEQYADDRGLVWPESIAPAQVHIVRIGDEEETVKTADELYEKLIASQIEVIYDDRNIQPGKMLADADLIGVPKRVIVSEKSLASGGIEVKGRTEVESTITTVDNLAELLR